MSSGEYEIQSSLEINPCINKPKHWREQKIRFLFTFDRGLGITKANLKDIGIPCVNYGEIHSKYGFEIIPEEQDLKCVDEDYLEDSPSAILYRGDFVFADTSEDFDGAGNFTHLNSEVTTFAGYHTVIARHTGGEYPRFLAYFFDSDTFRNQIRKNVSGVKVFSVTQAILKNSWVWLPPIEEQKKIAAFLDHKTKQIDELIEKKKALIEKLEEKRIAVITQAVTKGLDKTVKLTPSDVEWLGDVPEHWEVGGLLKFINNRVDYRGKTPEKVPEGIFLVTAKNIKSGLIDYETSKEYVKTEDYDLIMARGVPEIGDLLFTTEAPLGEVALVDKADVALAQRIIKFQGEESLLNSFAKYWMMSKPFQGNLESLATGSTALGIKASKLFELRAIVPPIFEQEEIVAHIETRLLEINSVEAKVKNAIDLLIEYRTALITSAVTGKIDVRNIEIRGV